jgi:hypothetical protein
VAALKTTPTPALKDMWRDLFETEPPPYNRRFLESRLAYRIQELAYGGLKPETIKRLEAIAADLDGGDPVRRRRPVNDRPISGTRLIREWQGIRVDVVVVYKIDRLSRSLMDFAKLVEVFDRNSVHLRQRNAVVQHDDVDGAAHAQRPAQLRAVRARSDRRAHP